jgi:glycosyltransferase involved in cell wall biosynthesis
MNRVLIITYYWPPAGGAGVQRWLKFSRYLPLFGVEPFILTVDPDYAVYPAIDHSLEKDIPAGTRVFRTRAINWFRLHGRNKSKVPSAGFATSLDNSLRGKITRFARGNFFIPDPRRGWNSFAFDMASRLIRDEGISAVITTSPPHSSHLIGLRLRKRFPSIRWIADLRDPWTGIYYYNLFYPTLLARMIDSYYEREVLEKADIIMTVGHTLGEHFKLKAPGIDNKIKIIHNGFDESDFDNVKIENPDRFTISYTGTLSGSYPLEGFASAVKKVIDKGNDLLLKFTGIIASENREYLVSTLGEENLRFLPYADHATVISQVMSSSLLLLVIPKHPDNRSTLSGKLFEYLASGKPVLCIGPVDGDAAGVLEKSGCGKCFDYNDTPGIADFISRALGNPDGNRPPVSLAFSRKNLAGEIASLIS